MATLRKQFFLIPFWLGRGAHPHHRGIVWSLLQAIAERWLADKLTWEQAEVIILDRADLLAITGQRRPNRARAALRTALDECDLQAATIEPYFAPARPPVGRKLASRWRVRWPNVAETQESRAPSNIPDHTRPLVIDDGQVAGGNGKARAVGTGYVKDAKFQWPKDVRNLPPGDWDEYRAWVRSEFPDFPDDIRKPLAEACGFLARKGMTPRFDEKLREAVRHYLKKLWSVPPQVADPAPEASE